MQVQGSCLCFFKLLDNRPFWDGKKVVEPDVKPLRLLQNLSRERQLSLDEVEERKDSGYIRFRMQQNVPPVSLLSELGFSDSEEEGASCDAMSSTDTPPPPTPSTDITNFIPSKSCIPVDEENDDDDGSVDDDELPGSREVYEELKTMALRLKPVTLERWVRDSLTTLHII